MRDIVQTKSDFRNLSRDDRERLFKTFPVPGPEHIAPDKHLITAHLVSGIRQPLFNRSPVSEVIREYVDKLDHDIGITSCSLEPYPGGHGALQLESVLQRGGHKGP